MLDKLFIKARSILRCPLNPVQVLGNRRTPAKVTSLLDSVSHSMHEAVGVAINCIYKEYFGNRLYNIFIDALVISSLKLKTFSYKAV